MERVFEIQANWDQREKLRNFAISRSPVIPPYQIQAPMYNPDNKLVVEPSNVKKFKFQQVNKQEISNEFLRKVKDKLESRMKIVEEDINKTMNEIQALKNEKEENFLPHTIVIFFFK
jgi:hypothetical protein